MKRLKQESGFTLMEMVLVITIITVLAAAYVSAGRSFYYYAKNTRATDEAASMAEAAAGFTLSRNSYPSNSALRSIYPSGVLAFGNSTGGIVNAYGQKLSITSADSKTATVSVPQQAGSAIAAPLTWLSGNTVNITSVIDHGVADEAAFDKKRLYSE